MARQKKPDNETPEQSSIRRLLEAVSNNADRSEKTSWNRKLDNMVTLIAKLRPLEEKIIALEAKKLPIFDEIQALRSMMVKECIHPFDHLTYHKKHVLCKFCNKRLSKPAGFEDDGKETA